MALKLGQAVRALGRSGGREYQIEAGAVDGLASEVAGEGRDEAADDAGDAVEIIHATRVMEAYGLEQARLEDRNKIYFGFGLLVIKGFCN